MCVPDGPCLYAAPCGPNDNRDDALHFTFFGVVIDWRFQSGLLDSSHGEYAASLQQLIKTINEGNGDDESDDDEDETTIGQILSDLPSGIKLQPWLSKSYDALKNERLNSGMKIQNPDDYTSSFQGKSSIFGFILLK